MKVFFFLLTIALIFISYGDVEAIINGNIQNVIVGYLARVVYKDRISSQCSGTILSERAVLSHGICFPDGVDTDVSKIHIHVGVVTDGGVEYNNVEKIVLPSSNPDSNLTFGIMKLSSDIRFDGDYVYAATLGTEWEPNFSKFKVYGWGQYDPNTSAFSSVLRVGTFNVRDAKTCNDMHNNHDKIANWAMCGLNTGNEVKYAVCYGDEGAPAVNIKSEVIGWVAETPFTCPKTYPFYNFFYRSSVFIEFLNNNK